MLFCDEEGGGGAGTTAVISAGMDMFSVLIGMYVQLTLLVFLIISTAFSSMSIIEAQYIANTIASETMKIRNGAYPSSDITVESFNPRNLTWGQEGVTMIFMTQIPFPNLTVENGSLKFKMSSMAPSGSIDLDVPDWPDCVIIKSDSSTHKRGPKGGRVGNQTNETTRCVSSIYFPANSTCHLKLFRPYTNTTESGGVYMEVDCKAKKTTSPKGSTGTKTQTSTRTNTETGAETETKTRRRRGG